jgi:hypothetical protein
MRRTKAVGPISHNVHLLLLGKRLVDKSGKYVGPLPAENDLIDVLCRSRRIHPARVTHVDQDGRFPIWAMEIEIPPSGILEEADPEKPEA